MSVVADDVIADLRAACGDANVITHPHQLKTYESDGLLQYEVEPARGGASRHAPRRSARRARLPRGRRAVGGARLGHGTLRRRAAGRGRRPDRAHAPAARSSRSTCANQRVVVRAGRHEPRDLARRRARRTSTRRTPRARSSARSAATSPRTPAARTASSTASRRTT